MATRKPQLDKSETIAELPAACASEAAAVAFLERKRWGDTPCCPKCGSVDVYAMTNRETGGRNARFLWRCRDCNGQYTVRTGTVYEESLIPLHKWLRAVWEAASAKNGVSALEMSRKLEISYKSALFLMHRIRHAMSDNPTDPPKLSGKVECDETYVGGKPRHRPARLGDRRKPSNKRGRGTKKTPVFAVVQRGGDVRARVIPNVTAATLKAALVANVEQGTTIYTDDLRAYRKVCKGPGTHKVVRHSYGEYVKHGDPDTHTNTIEGYFSRVKRGLNGTYHAVSKEHLPRYLDQFCFLYNTRGLNDGERLEALLKRADGKRLMYREPVKRRRA
ncbi:MAG TPA: IS1595 family transposase [Phycisphaerales bacterium]|nr:IS1595 family transposase [Phycisphaerales bacterium]